jgi:hypothetical protein
MNSVNKFAAATELTATLAASLFTVSKWEDVAVAPQSLVFVCGRDSSNSRVGF